MLAPKLAAMKQSVNKVVWGILGVGDVCEKKSAPAMDKIDHSEISVVMRRNPDQAADFAQRHGVSRWTDQVDEVINDPEVNAIYIATPPHVHTELALKAAAAGKPTYVEKPMARTYEECHRMVDAFQQANVPLWVAYYRRALPNVLRVKELLKQNAIGEVRMVTIELYQPLRPTDANASNWRVHPEVSGGGYFHDLASHQLDLLDFLFGPIQYAHGFSTNQAGAYPADDAVAASFRFASGVLGTGSWCFAAHQYLDQITIQGEGGTIRFDAFTEFKVNIETKAWGSKEYAFTMPEHIQQPLIQQIVDELRGIGQCVSTGSSAARTGWVMDQILR